MFDVVIVPDFAGKRRAVFEAQTLLFLAAWRQNAGEARRFPLHLACVGEPPATVAKLAESVGARVSVHRPVSEDCRFMNKNLAGNVSRETDRLLLLDADIVVLQDPSALADVPASAISATPEMHPKISREMWSALYEMLEVAPPRERIESRIHELGLPLKYEHFAGESAELAGMMPWWNAGMSISPWRIDLLGRWRKNLERVRSLPAPDLPGWEKRVQLNDQPAFAVTVNALRQEGVPFQRLPGGFNVFWQSLYARAIPLSQVSLFHATTIFRHMGSVALTRDAFERELERYSDRLDRRSRRLWRQSGRSPESSVQMLVARATRRRLIARLHRLYREQIRSLL